MFLACHYRRIYIYIYIYIKMKRTVLANLFLESMTLQQHFVRNLFAEKMIGMWMHVDDVRDRYQCFMNAKFYKPFKVMVINMSVPVAHDKN